IVARLPILTRQDNWKVNCCPKEQLPFPDLRCSMSRPKRCFTFRYVVCLLGMALLAIPAKAQNFAYVANFNSNSVSVIDTASNTVTATLGVGVSPSGVAITPDGTRAYVTNTFSNSVSVVDTASNTLLATVAVGNQPRGVAITPDGTRAYVTNLVSNS